ncbi:hypothetical protein [Flavobacterium kingsejongi]|uniref:Uncharacterized protein n=1 Tax=Flavobacterium kingsejongi TaxID=1678728 RepID=A0A2S1LPY4_9FLAO|nr:hypothetical protein [Flavobacterium kingsejongi]AWG25722.1 hypothetical protein FK004_11080 [Flavobacterium kingsejongi]
MTTFWTENAANAEIVMQVLFVVLKLLITGGCYYITKDILMAEYLQKRKNNMPKKEKEPPTV